jgi:hypothetical protein
MSTRIETYPGSKQDIQELESLPQSGILQSRKMVPISRNLVENPMIPTSAIFWGLILILGITLWSVGAVQNSSSLILAGKILFGLGIGFLALVIAVVAMQCISPASHGERKA